MNDEIWKDLYFVENGITYDYRGKYQISNLGNVKSLNYHKWNREQILKSVKNEKGYLIVTLCKNGKTKNFKIHRLVAHMFIPNPDNLPEVNHKNEIRDCNLLTNLEWCTSEYNNRYSQSKKINQCDLQGNFIKTWNSTREIERELGFAHSHIGNVCKQKRKTAYGYIWRYADG